MKLIDIHAHLESPRFKDLNKIIKDAKTAGVKTIIQSGTDPKRNRLTLEISKKFDIVKPSFGMYPVGNLSVDLEKEISWIKKHEECIAIGEIGMDFDNHQRKKHHKEQEVLFRKMLALAKELNKPVIIHSRKAEKECIEILKEEKQEKVIMHCFSGKKNLVKRAYDLGYYFSIPTNVVRLQQFQEMVTEVDINHLFCETDAPFLSPFKDKRNEPAFVIESYKKIAEIKGLTLEETKKNIWMNFQKLFL